MTDRSVHRIGRQSSVIHIVPHLDETTGGQATAALSLAGAMYDLQWQPTFLTVALADKPTFHDLIDNSRMTVVETQPSKHLHVGTRSPNFRQVFESVVTRARPAIIHAHSVWGFPTMHAFAVAKKYRIPFVVSPRSEFYPLSLRNSRFKKWIARHLFVNDLLENADAFHATDAPEAEAIRAIGAKGKILVSSDGIDTRIGLEMPDTVTAKKTLGLPTDRRYVLFLSRVNYRKNPELFLKAAIDSGMLGHDWGAIIAGGIDDEGMVQSMNSMAKAAGVEDRVYWIGHADWAKKRNCYAACDFFALPTQFENFGIVIAEALACGKPVATSPTTPWGHLPGVNAGWIVEPKLDVLTALYSRISMMPKADLEAMAPLARDTVAPLGWDKAAADMDRFYLGLLSR